MITNGRGKHKRHYRTNDYPTPYRKSFPKEVGAVSEAWHSRRSAGAAVRQRSGTDAALHMQKAKLELSAERPSMPR